MTTQVVIAFHGLAKEEILARMALRDTGERDPYLEAETRGGWLANGWYVLWSFDFGMYDDVLSSDPSAGGRVVACLTDDTTMMSAARENDDGSAVWSVTHYGDDGSDHLETDGDLPHGFVAIRARFAELHASQGRGRDRVDYIYEIPIETAAAVTGFRSDESDLEGPEVGAFTILEPA